jgi:hypothetical protein
MTSQEITLLKETNYVKKAQPKNDYWVDFNRKKINEVYLSKFGVNFNIIIYSQPDTESGFYIIPFSELQPLFKDEYLSKDATIANRKRWVITIKNHIFKVTNNPETADIKEYYSNIYLANKFDKQEEKNEFEIENKRQEINVRLKQSKFRRLVLENFEGTCSISNIKEENLLVASHIIPWADKKEVRLDPANGICLSVMYDKLFDKGYFTLSDELQIQVINDTSKLSSPLKEILKEINGRKIANPIQPIKTEYLKYHRENIFIERADLLNC